MKQIFIWSLPLIFASCTNYSSYFDCASHPGAGCQSVSQIEAMIIEHPNGEDCFCESCPRHREVSPPLNKKVQLPELNESHLKQRVWICPQRSEQGYLVEGHYIYFNEEEKTSPISEPQQ